MGRAGLEANRAGLKEAKRGRGNTLTIKLSDDEIRMKCSVLYRLNGVIIETMLKILFSRVDITEILKVYVSEGVEGVRRLIIETFDDGWELRV
jgi:Zn-dependent M16 (insulinase) family peptidase